MPVPNKLYTITYSLQSSHLFCSKYLPHSLQIFSRSMTFEQRRTMPPTYYAKPGKVLHKSTCDVCHRGIAESRGLEFRQMNRDTTRTLTAGYRYMLRRYVGYHALGLERKLKWITGKCRNTDWFNMEGQELSSVQVDPREIGVVKKRLCERLKASK